MIRIAILACEQAHDVCAGTGCFDAIYDRTGDFEFYGSEDLRLTGFFLCNHCTPDAPTVTDAGDIEKLECIVKYGTEIAHVGVCSVMDGRVCPYIKVVENWLRERGVSIVHGTHKCFMRQFPDDEALDEREQFV